MQTEMLLATLLAKDLTGAEKKEGKTMVGEIRILNSISSHSRCIT